MNKPQIVFVFGKHGLRKDNTNQTRLFGLDTLPDRAFFDRAMREIFESKVVAAGKKVTVIHEMCISLGQRHKFSPEQKTDFLKRTKTEGESKILLEWLQEEENIQTRLIQKYFGENKNFTYEDWDWGFNDFLKEFTMNNPALIEHLIEPVSHKNVELEFEQELLFDALKPDTDENSLKLLVAFFKLLRRGVINRDKCLRRRILKIFMADPNRLIVVPRGAGHFGILSIFSRSKFDYSYKLGKMSYTFSDHITTFPYHQDPSNEQVVASARLDQILVAKIRKHSSGLRGIWITYKLSRSPNPSIESRKFMKKLASEIAAENPDLIKFVWFNPQLPLPWA
jgi:hypothetical protein